MTDTTAPEPVGDEASDVDDLLDDEADADVDVDAYIRDALGSRPRPIDWRRLSGDRAAATWAELDAWVRWVVTRYALDHRDVPPCWHAHGDLVEELSALMTAHAAAYDPAGNATGPSEWHQTLGATRQRLQIWAARTGCRRSEHRPPQPPTWVSDDDADG